MLGGQIHLTNVTYMCSTPQFLITKKTLALDRMGCVSIGMIHCRNDYIISAGGHFINLKRRFLHRNVASIWMVIKNVGNVGVNILSVV